MLTKKIFSFFLAFAIVVEALLGSVLVAFAQDGSQDVGEATNTIVSISANNAEWTTTENATESSVDSAGTADVEGNIQTGSENSENNSENTENVENSGADVSNHEWISANVANSSSDENAAENAEATPQAGPAAPGAGDLVVTALAKPEATNADGSVKTIYPTGENIVVYVGFRSSGESGSISGAKMRVTIPKKWLKSAPIFGKMDSALSMSTSSDDTNYYAVYNLNNVTGGLTPTTPITLIHNNLHVPNGFETPVTVEILMSDNSVLTTTTTSIVAQADEMKPYFQVHAVTNKVYWIDSDYQPSYMSPYSTGRMETIDGKPTSVANLPVDSTMNNTPTWEQTPYVTYELGYYLRQDKKGVYLGEKNDITVKLPVGGVFDAQYGTNTRNWKYDANTHSVTYIWRFSNYMNKNYVELKVLFPNQSFNTVHHAQATISRDVWLATEKTATFDWYHKWNKIDFKRQFNFSKVYHSDYADSWYPGKNIGDFTMNFTLSIYGNSREKISPYTEKIIEVQDYGLDQRLYYKNIWIFYKGGYSVIGVDTNGVEHLIEKISQIETATTRTTEVNDETQRYQKIILRFDEPYDMQNYNPSIYIKTGIKKDYWNTITLENIEQIQKERFLNKAKVLYIDTEFPDEIKEREHLDYGNINLRTQQILLEKATTRDLVYTSGNNTFNIYPHFQVHNNSAYYSREPIVGIKNIFLLPKGIEYISHNSTLQDIQIVENYKNTGKQAVILTPKEVCPRSNSSYCFFEELNFKVHPYAREGVHAIEHYGVWSNTERVTIHNDNYYNTLSTPDTLDMDNDGNTTEQFAKQIHTVNFIPPREVLLYSEVSTTKTGFSEGITEEIGKDANYRVTLFNNSLSEVTNATIVDVLPYVGDHAIVPDKTGAYQPRNSAFRTPLTASLESVPENADVLQKWDVYYSTENQGATTDSVRDARYVRAADITNWADVKMIKMVLKSGQKVDIKEEVNFILPTRIPNDQNILSNASVRNSAAISFNGRDFIEGAASTIAIARYNISGKIFNDVNKNGQKDENENFISGYAVTIKNEAGVVVGITTTNANGEYSYTVSREGKYYAEIAKKTNSDEFSSTIVPSTNTLIGNSGTPEGNISKSPIISFIKGIPAMHNSVQNFGISMARGSITIHKVGENNTNLAGVTFALKKDNVKIGTSLATNNEGKIIISDLELGNYDIVEESTLPEYRLDTTPQRVTISDNNLNITKKIVNQKQTWNIKIVKTKQGGGRLAGATFELRKDGVRVGNPLVTPENGEIIFTGVEYGNYTLVETAAPVGYKEASPVTISTTSFNKNSSEILLNVENQNQLWNVKVIKKDEAGNPLEGATFELRDAKNVRVGEAKVTPKSGEIIFTNIIRGDYKIVETSAPVGYTEALPTVVSQNDFIKTATEVIKDIINKKQLWNLVLTKKNPEWNVLSGAKFELRDQKGAVVATKTSDQNGRLTFENLTYQNYSLVEIEAPVGYSIMQPLSIPKETFVREKKDIEMDVLNTKQKWNLKILKTDNEDKTLSGVEFELRKGTAEGEIIATKTTGENGEIIFENLTYDSYILIEKSAPMAYKILDPIAIGLDKFDKNLTEIILPVKNEKQLWKVKVLKIDIDTKKPLSGAVFVLKDEADKEIAKQVSDSQGEILFENIVYGNYTISEIVPPLGYIGNAEIKVTTENFDKNIDTIQLIAKNKKIPVNYTSSSIPSGPGGCANCGTPVTTTTTVTPPAVVTSTPPVLETPKTPFTMSFADIVEKWETEIKKFPQRMPRTGQMLDETIYKKAGIVGQKLRKQLDTSLKTEDFRLAGSTETSLDFWKQVLPEVDKNANKYIVIPSVGLVMPINSVEKNSRAYNNFINGKNEDFAKYLETGAVDLTGTSTRGFGEVGNKVLGGHSSYWKHSAGRYKTHFQKIIAMTEGQEIWIYEKNSENKFIRYVYRTTLSQNTSEKDISALKPTDHVALTLFTCTPIGGITGRWVVKSEFIGKFSAE